MTAFLEISQIPISVQVLVGGLLLSITYYLLFGQQPYRGIPLLKPDSKGLLAWLPAKYAFMLKPKEIFDQGLRQFPGCFQVQAASAYKIIVPNRYVEELKSNKDLGFEESFTVDKFILWPGFDGFNPTLHHGIVANTSKGKLTQNLNNVTGDLVEETAYSFEHELGSNFEWQTLLLRDAILNVVAGLSTRVFLGVDFARDTVWLKIAKEYAVNGFVSQTLLSLFPKSLQRLAYWVLPPCRQMRQNVVDARRMLTPMVDDRQKTIDKATEAGAKAEVPNDSVTWMIETAKGQKDIDIVAGQLGLSLASIHTTTEILTQAIVQLCDTPEIVAPLREEAIKVLQEDGWSKTTWQKMRLIDSFLKEVQRTRDNPATMQRYVKKDITLSDGTILPSGALLLVRDDQVRDARTYEEPEKFDPWRYLKLRQRDGEENRYQMVTTSADNLGFGYGSHSCPGRFFAANELKVALCFLLLKYEVRFVPGESRPALFAFEEKLTMPDTAKIQLRRRKEEIDPLHPR